MGLFDRLFGKKKDNMADLSHEMLEQEGTSDQEELVEEHNWGTIQEVTEHSLDEVAIDLPEPEAIALPNDQYTTDFDRVQDIVEDNLAELNQNLSTAEEIALDQLDWDMAQEVAEDSFTEEIIQSEEESDKEEILFASPNWLEEGLPSETSAGEEVPVWDSFLEQDDVQPSSRAEMNDQNSSATDTETREDLPASQVSEGVTTSIPSSLERAVEILRDKEKRAAAVQEAQAKKEEEARQAALLEEAIAGEETAIVETTQEKYDRSLKKTRTGFGAKLNAFFANFRSVDEEFFEDLEELLISSDVGVQVATKLTEDLRQEAKLENVKKGEDLRLLIIQKLVEIYEQDGNFEAEKIHFQEGLTVMLFVGVNGVGKTTSIGKLANQYKKAGKKVLLVAADTFRAGAVAQLVEWGKRVGVDVVTGPEKSDPASVVYDGMERAVAEGVDILLIDTAGRLQNKDNLMAELEKIGRIIKRVLPEAPHETLLALDASTGQNALVQAKEFSKITPLTGLVLTKIDGTARGGVVLAIRQELDIPVKLIGFGEKIDDIGQFDSEDFMRGLLEGLI
ncbi:signal recognition particle-docking protein FtsY [Streptococcus ovuberis]|uniref:Signal recognition particle receptor FtsY n=1 Tax=Streptococcus ovuberis TaxID=1936207 RepID=A0A7X6RZN8_9STRE|nr:signal recognition particle-docking protein FtsY [Streptococcus ovuberis]NKZ19338.1 signal recognition particle-docking protein FtsY [Streptococcus ovuberis]